MTVRLEGSGLCGSFIGESGGAFWVLFGFEALFLGMYLASGTGVQLRCQQQTQCDERLTFSGVIKI